VSFGPPKWTFSRDYISAIRDTAASNFYMWYRLNKVSYSRTCVTGQPQVGLCPIFLVVKYDTNTILIFSAALCYTFELQDNAVNVFKTWRRMYVSFVENLFISSVSFLLHMAQIGGIYKFNFTTEL